MAVHLDFRRPPSAFLIMLRALAPSPGLRRGMPDLSARWRNCQVDPAQLAAFHELTSLGGGEHLSILYPHVIGFRLIMAVLTHPAYPLPIWNALQIRNRLVQHEAIPAGATMTYETSIGERRFLETGVEIDLRTQVHLGTALAWESINTFYYRGRFGAPRTGSPRPGSPNAGETQVAAWPTLTGVGWRFGGLTGDFNGVHMSDGYARRFGFKRAFHHPQLIIGQCLARLPAPASARQELETWVKGPVPYGVDVRLHATTEATRTTFAVFADEETRPAIVGRWGATV